MSAGPIRAAVLGATGYTALELIKLLLPHPRAEVVALTSRQAERPHVAEVHPQLAQRLDLRLEPLDPADLAGRVDVVFSCLPHAASAESVAPLLDAGLRVIDFSADYRLQDAETYARWYGHPHVDPSRLSEAVYGLPELFREAIRSAQLVANPGCYPTSAILALAPLLQRGLVEAEGLIIDSKSGVSGAGRTPKLMTHFPECNESVEAYSVASHRHTPEIDQLLSHAAGRRVEVVFTPHLIPMNQGIFSTCYARAAAGTTVEQLLSALDEAYREEPFVRVSQQLPASRNVRGTNYCDLSVRQVGRQVIVLSCIDNMIKGASGAAVQNMNLMFGLSETCGLGG